MHGSISPRLRALAILAFAWNPLLLFEAAVNAHCDTTILFFVLLALWLLYCAIGTPWFWPWYTVTFFGLFALVASVEVDSTREQRIFKALRSPQFISLCTFCMLSLYCFFTLGPLNTFVPWLPRFRWAYLRGLWAWSLPLLALYLSSNAHVMQTSYHLLHQRLFNFRHRLE